MFAVHNYLCFEVKKNSVMKKNEEWENRVKSIESTGSKVQIIYQ